MSSVKASRQSGFTTIEIVLAALVVILVGLGIWRAVELWHFKNDESVAKSGNPAPNKYVKAKLSCSPRTKYTVSPGSTTPAKNFSGSIPHDDVNAILAIDPDCGKVLMAVNLKNVKYSFCSNLKLSDAQGKPASISEFPKGSYVYSKISDTCVASLQLVPKPVQCSAGYGGGASVFFVAYNQSAGSIVYQPTGGSDLYAARVCTDVIATDINKTAMSPAALREGDPVQMLMSGELWIKSITKLKNIDSVPS